MVEKDTNSRSNVWMEQAIYDLQAAKLSIDNNFFEWAAYQAEQAAEKALKAVVVHAGLRPPRMHKLGMLFGICNQANEKFRNTKFNFKHLESFTFISRYPFLLPGRNKAPHDLINLNDAQKAFDEAQDLVDKIKTLIVGGAMIVAGPITSEPVYSSEEVAARLEEIKTILVPAFNPEKIILFGRFARETGPITGTMDVLMIANSNLDFVDRIVKARELTRGAKIIIEPLIYTPEEFNLMTKEEGEGFFESALEEGKVIYQKPTLNN